MNVTLIYAFLAYSSIKQRDFSGVYVSCYWTPVSHVIVYTNIFSFFVIAKSTFVCYMFLQMVQQIPVSVHVWPPLCSFTTYFIAWYILHWPKTRMASFRHYLGLYLLC